MWMSTSKDTRHRMSEIVYEWRIAINPAGPAFGIWGIIYIFDMCFVIYQALPQSWEPTRDNNLIYGQIGVLFAINRFFQAFWLIVWKRSTPWAFKISGIINSVMCATALIMLQYA